MVLKNRRPDRAAIAAKSGGLVRHATEPAVCSDGDGAEPPDENQEPSHSRRKTVGQGGDHQNQGEEHVEKSVRFHVDLPSLVYRRLDGAAVGALVGVHILELGAGDEVAEEEARESHDAVSRVVRGG